MQSANPVPVGRKITTNQLWSKSEVSGAIQNNNQLWWTQEDVAGDGGASRGGLGRGGRWQGEKEHNKAHSIKRSRWGDMTMMATMPPPKI
jgi:hypothetical protein